MISSIEDPPFTTGLAWYAGTLPDHISPSAAKTYLGCSLKFYFERVACIKKKTPPALHLGKAVHAALRAFHLARWRARMIHPKPSPLPTRKLSAISNGTRDR